MTKDIPGPELLFKGAVNQIDRGLNPMRNTNEMVQEDNPVPDWVATPMTFLSCHLT